MLQNRHGDIVPRGLPRGIVIVELLYVVRPHIFRIIISTSFAHLLTARLQCLSVMGTQQRIIVPRGGRERRRTSFAIGRWKLTNHWFPNQLHHTNADYHNNCICSDTQCNYLSSHPFNLPTFNSYFGEYICFCNMHAC